MTSSLKKIMNTLPITAGSLSCSTDRFLSVQQWFRSCPLSNYITVINGVLNNLDNLKSWNHKINKT